jgi:chromosome segregation ATPase
MLPAGNPNDESESAPALTDDQRRPPIPQIGGNWGDTVKNHSEVIERAQKVKTNPWKEKYQRLEQELSQAKDDAAYWKRRFDEALSKEQQMEQKLEQMKQDLNKAAADTLEQTNKAWNLDYKVRDLQDHVERLQDRLQKGYFVVYDDGDEDEDDDDLDPDNPQAARSSAASSQKAQPKHLRR